MGVFLQLLCAINQDSGYSNVTWYWSRCVHNAGVNVRHSYSARGHQRCLWSILPTVQHHSYYYAFPSDKMPPWATTGVRSTVPKIPLHYDLLLLLLCCDLPMHHYLDVLLLLSNLFTTMVQSVLLRAHLLSTLVHHSHHFVPRLHLWLQ